MKVLIPDDWDGEDWQCIKVAWPKSPKWTALIAGLLTSPTRGRWYEETSGDIKAAQEIGLEIFDRNIPFDYCDGTMPEPEKIIEYLSGAGIVIEESEDMGQVVTDVQVVGGKLRIFYGHCCYVDLDMTGVTIPGEVSIPQPGDEDEIEIPSGSPLEVTSSCAKASKVVEVVADITDTMLDGVYSGHTPWGIMNTLRTNYPGVAFGQADFLNGYQAALNVTAQGFASEVEDPNFYQDLRYQFSTLLSSTAAGVTSEEYTALKAALDGVVNEYFNATTYPTGFLSMGTLQRSSLKMIGANDIRDLTSYIAATGAENCQPAGYDPGVATAPDANGWYLGPQQDQRFVEIGNDNWHILYTREMALHKAFGFVVMGTRNAAGEEVKRMSWSSAEGYEAGLPSAEVSMTGDTSDHIGPAFSTGVPRPIINCDDAAVKASVMAGLGYSAGEYEDKNAPAAFVCSTMTTPATPGKILGVRFDVYQPEDADAFILEGLRLIYNVNDGTH